MGINYSPTLVTDGLILCLDGSNRRSYPGTGVTWTDLSSSGKSGTGQTGVTYSSLNSGKFILNGAESGYFSIPLVTTTITNVTMCCWVNITTTSLRGPFIVNGSFTGYAIGVGSDSYDTFGNNLIALFPGNRWIGAGVSLGLGWKHVAITLDGSSLPRIYLNGQLINSYAGINPRVPTTATYIGREVGGENVGITRAFGGEIGMAQMYNRQLSDAEILQNYNAQKKKYNPEENFITDGAVFVVDANNIRSYAGAGSGFTSIAGSVNGTLINSPTFNTGTLTFNGSNQYVDFGNSSAVQQSSGTLSAWVRTSSPGAGFRGIIAKQGAYGLFYLDSVLAAYDWSSGTKSTSINIADGNWKNVVMTYQSGVTNGTIIYLNGSSVLTTTITVNNQAQGNLYGSAEANAGQLAACTAASFSMYSKALTSTEVLQNYNALKGRFGL
jgi:hypothetical protein